MLKSTQQLEGCFYRRRSDQARSDWSYHNHILQGPFLRFIRRPLSTKEASSYRLVLTAGKAKGRLKEMLLHEESELTTANLNDSESPSGSSYIVNISGKCDGVEQRWQLAMATVQEQKEWLHALQNAKSYMVVIQESGDYKKLEYLARKMLHEIEVRNRMRRFKIHRGVFVGNVAVKWMMKELGCSNSNAVQVGNLMLNCQLFHHVGREHIFCDKKLYYRFASFLAQRKSSDTHELDFLHEKEDSKILSIQLEKLKNKHTALSGNIAYLANHCVCANEKIASLQLMTRALLISVCALLIRNNFPQVNSILYAASACLVCGYFGYTCYRNLSEKDSQLQYLISQDHKSKGTKEDDEDDEDDDEDEEMDPQALLDASEVVDMNEDDGDVDLSDLELMRQEEEEDDEELEIDMNQDGDNTTVDVNELSANGRNEMELSIARTVQNKALKKVPSADIPDVATWTNPPILVRRSPCMLMSSCEEDPTAIKNLLSPLSLCRDGAISDIPIESDLFVGKIVFTAKGIGGACDDYFYRKKRKSRMLLQGRFKIALPFSSVYTGQVFDEPIKSFPAKLFSRTMIQLMIKLHPGFRLSMRGDKPFFLAPLVSSSQRVHVSRLGAEPKLNIHNDLEEDMSLLGRKYVGMSWKRRRAYFSRRKNLLKHYYDPNLVYTFDFYQHILNFSTFKAQIGMLKYDLLKLMGSRPVQLMAIAWDPLSGENGGDEDDDDEDLSTSRKVGKLVSNTRAPPPENWPYLFNLELLHERSVNHNSSEIHVQSDHTQRSTGRSSFTLSSPIFGNKDKEQRSPETTDRKKLFGFLRGGR